MNHSKIFGVIVVTASITVTGCATIKDMTTFEDVKPWKRNVLAKDEMRLSGDEIDSYVNDHTYFSKEASTGGKGVGGGGCGCN